MPRQASTSAARSLDGTRRMISRGLNSGGECCLLLIVSHSRSQDREQAALLFPTWTPDDDVWELYHLDKDWTQNRDLAAEDPSVWPG